MRNILVTLLLAGLLTGCTGSKPASASCAAGQLGQSPVLAGIQAYGLAGELPWFPGQAWKVNWSSTSGGTPEIDLALQRVGQQQPSYRMHLQAEPSLIGIPEPGCWDLTLTRDGQADTVRLQVTMAPLAGLVPGGMDSQAPLVNESALAMALLKGAAATPRELPANRRGAELQFAWQTPDGLFKTPAVYYPAQAGEPPLLAVQRSLLTGACTDQNAAAAGLLAAGLAKRLEQALGRQLTVVAAAPRPWARYEGNCHRFEPIK